MSSRSRNYQRNNIFIFVIIILVSLGSIITSKYTLDKQYTPIEPGYNAISETKDSFDTNQSFIVFSDRNSFYKQSHPVRELKKLNITIEYIVVPDDLSQVNMLTHEFKNERVITFEQLDSLTIKSKNILYDLQHIGLRDEPYNLILKHVLELTDQKKIKLFISDRLNFYTSNYIDGPVVQMSRLSVEKSINSPLFHGFTTGELALAMSEHLFLSTDINVLLMKNFYRARKPNVLDLNTNFVTSELIDYNLYIEYPINLYLKLFGLNTYSFFTLNSNANAFNIEGIRFYKTFQNGNGGYRLKLNQQIFTNYFEFYYKFTQLLIQSQEIKLTPILEQNITNFIGSHDFIESIKNGNSWEQYKQLLDDYKAAFYDQYQSYLLY